MPDTDRAYRVLALTDRYPEHLDMGSWIRYPGEGVEEPGNLVGLTDVIGHCGTTACFAGWTIFEAGYLLGPNAEVYDIDGTVIGDVDVVAADLLGIDEYESKVLFYVVDNDQLGETVQKLFGPRPAHFLQPDGGVMITVSRS